MPCWTEWSLSSACKQNNNWEYLKITGAILSATKAISGENYTSVSLIIPLVKQLQQQYLPSHHTTASLNRILSQELCQRYWTFDSRSYHSVLDVVTRRMTHELASLKTSEGSQSESDSLPATESLPVPKTNELWASFDQKVTDYNSRRSTMSDSILRYDNTFPNLQKLARKYLYFRAKK